MMNISKFPDRSLVKKETAEWLILLDGDDKPTAPVLDELREWLGRSPVHREELNSLNAFWGNNVLTELMVPPGQHVQPHGFRSAFRSFLREHSFGLSGFAAASVCVFMVFNLWVAAGAMTETNGIYLTAVGQQKTLALADGSVVELNTNSQVEVEYTDQHRNIRLLQGEAYFDVAKDPDHPFRVYAGAGRVQAVGTAFTVYLRDEGVNILVSEGRVALASLGVSRSSNNSSRPLMAGNQLASSSLDTYVNSESKELGTLGAGQSVTLDSATLNSADSIESTHQELIDNVSLVDDKELSRRQSWRDGLLIFSGEPLEQVVEEISRYTTVSIEITDPILRQIQIGGRFKAGDVDNMFSALEANFGLEVNRLSYNRAQLTLAE